MKIKRLSEIDPNYRGKMLQLNKNEKINYCNELIDRFQGILEKNRYYLSEKLKHDFHEIILSAQEEIKELSK